MSTAFEQARAKAAAARQALGNAFDELASLIESIEDPDRRGIVNALIWDCAAQDPARAPFFSQYGQDAYLDTHVFGGAQGLSFVEVGAFDGVTHSNSLFFEMFRRWDGLLIEAVSEQIEGARSFRKCRCVEAVIGHGNPTEFLTIDGGPVQMSGLTQSYDPRRWEWIQGQTALAARRSTVATQTLETIFDDAGLSRVDLVSLDIEGAEASVLASFPFDRISVRCWLVDASKDRDAVRNTLSAAGYVWIERIGDDDIYVFEELA